MPRVELVADSLDNREERILLLGSGMTVYNPKDASKHDINNPAFYVSTYGDAVEKMLVDNTGSVREIKASQITFRPDYRRAHPTPEALFALYFAVGAAGDDEAEILFSMHDGSMAVGGGHQIIRDCEC